MLSPQIQLAIKTLSCGSEGIAAVLNMTTSGEVLKKTDTSIIEKIQAHLRSVHQQYLDTFEQLRKQAIEEGKQENRRR